MSNSPFDPSYQNSDVDGRIVAGLERISEVFRVLLWEEGKKHGLSPIQIQILIFLLHHVPGRRKVSYLAREFNMTKATISDAIKVLEEKELIEKVTEAADSRSYVIYLTSKGRKVAKQTAGFAGALQKPVEKIGRHDKEVLLKSIIDVIHQLNSAGLIQNQRMCTRCRFFQERKNGQPPYCQLLQKDLPIRELRLDCPEYEAHEA